MKCDCAEPEKPHHSKEKCIHIRAAEEKAKQNGSFVEEHPEALHPAHLAAVAEEQGCCCHHGGTCTCAVLKKETGEDDATPPHGKPAVQKPHLETTRSDGSITIFANGHHKPCHRKNHAAHESGMPYKMPMSRSQTDPSREAARRSVDSLSLENIAGPSTFAAPPTSAPYNPARRLSKSEQTSPRIRAQHTQETCSGGLNDPRLTAIDFSNLDSSQDDLSTQSATNSTFPTFDPMSGLADSSFDPWSALPSGDSTTLPNNNPFGVWPTSNDAAGVVQPPLTAASSGTQSEIDDLPPMEDVYQFGMPSIQEDASGFNFDNLTSSPQSNRRSLPPGFFGNTDYGSGVTSFDWQAAGLGDNTVMEGGKAKTSDLGERDTVFDNEWQMQTFPSSTSNSSLPHRPMGGLPDMASSGRPQSHTIGPGSAPNDDVMRQLFPELDIDSTAYASGSGSSTNARASSAIHIKPNYGSYDDDIGFTSQPWADGSMSVPNDPINFGGEYDLNQDFSNPDLTSNWTQ